MSYSFLYFAIIRNFLFFFFFFFLWGGGGVIFCSCRTYKLNTLKRETTFFPFPCFAFFLKRGGGGGHGGAEGAANVSPWRKESLFRGQIPSRVDPFLGLLPDVENVKLYPFTLSVSSFSSNYHALSKQ